MPWPTQISGSELLPKHWMRPLRYTNAGKSLQRFLIGETKVVVSRGVLKEGFDEPSIGCVIIARPTKSKSLYIQMIASGTRAYRGKADCLILNVVGAKARHALQTAEELFGLDLGKGTVREAVAERNRRLDSLTADTMYEEGKLFSSAVNLFQNRILHWQQTRQGAWVWSLGKDFLRLVSEAAEKWAVVKVDGDQHEDLARCVPLDYSMGVPDDDARK